MDEVALTQARAGIMDRPMIRGYSEKWQEVWRQAIAPQISNPGLEALRKALELDDARLLQGATTSPPALWCTSDVLVDGACGIAFCAWQGDGLRTVGEVEEYFIEVCLRAEQVLDEPAGHCTFLTWFDKTARDEMRRLLLEEINRSLVERESA